MKRIVVALAGGALLLVACGTVQNPAKEDAGVRDDAQIPVDATNVDAGVDAGMAMSPPGQDMTGGSGRLTGATYTLDVQLGHPSSQRPIQGPTRRLEGNAPIKP